MAEQGSKIAVVLMNLGGPDSKEAIEPFLKNFFSDPNIIQLPGFLRRFVAQRIATKRSKNEAGDSYAHLGYCSPLLANTQAQSQSLEKHLNQSADSQNRNESYKCFVCMRYWTPRACDVIKEVQTWQPDEIVLLPLYPQFSTTTTWSSFEEWHFEAQKIGYSCKTKEICCYPKLEGFIEASADNIRRTYEEAKKACGREPRLLLSAHGLPEKIIKGGDPYQWQCEQSAQAIVDVLNIPNLDWQICYQSRVGPLKWIGPSTDEALEKASQDQVPVIIYPHAFVSEHVETLVEIEMEYRELANKINIPYFQRVPTVGIHDAFIKGLTFLVENEDNYQPALCPSSFQKCFCQKRAMMSSSQRKAA